VESGAPCSLQPELCVIARRRSGWIDFDETAEGPICDSVSGKILVFLIGFLIDRYSPAYTAGVFAIGANAAKVIEGLRLTHLAHILSLDSAFHDFGVDHILFQSLSSVRSEAQERRARLSLTGMGLGCSRDRTIPYR
jgi:hypothetical protein